MKTQQVQKSKAIMNVLKGLPMVSVFRCLDMACFEFGDMVKKKVFGRDAEGKPAFVEVCAGEYALHIQSSFRISLGNELVLTRSDVFRPSVQLANDVSYNENDFDYLPKGNNRFDEAVEQRFSDLAGFVVKSTMVSQFGDLKLVFENGYQMEALVDVSDDQECWRFFRAEAQEHLIVNGLGLEA